MHMISLSSVWRSTLFRTGESLIAELMQSGLHSFEIEYRVEQMTLEEIEKLALQGHFIVSSVHNYCPHPHEFPWQEASGDIYSLASLDESERLKAVQATTATITNAQKLKAQAVVLHLGRVEMSFDRKLYLQLFEDGAITSPWAGEFLNNYLAERNQRKQPHLNAVKRSLEAIIPYAQEAGIKLGIENRYHLFQIPDFSEIGMLLDTFSDDSIGYWHDVGHAAVMGYLGLPGNAEYLKTYGSRLIGSHIHDCIRNRDHTAPGTGVVDFFALGPYLRQAGIKVLELKSSVTIEQIRFAIDLLRRTGIVD